MGLPANPDGGVESSVSARQRPGASRTSDDYVYWLGPERGLFSIDSEWLVLKFKDNVVTRAAVLTD